jgi:hypothetical protein
MPWQAKLETSDLAVDHSQNRPRCSIDHVAL